MIKKLFFKLLNYIKSIFLNGLLTILPIALTIGVFVYTFRLFKAILEPLNCMVPRVIQEKVLYNIPHSEFILAFLLIILIGAIFKNFFLKSLLHEIESTFFKLPLMQPLYFGIKQLVQAFTVKDKLTFKKVVFVEFPRKEIYSIGFLTTELPPTLSPNQRKKFYNIFIPTTPNPTTGYLILVPEEDIIIVDLTRQEAMSLIISGGIIQPDRYQ